MELLKRMIVLVSIIAISVCICVGGGQPPSDSSPPPHPEKEIKPPIGGPPGGGPGLPDIVAQILKIPPPRECKTDTECIGVCKGKVVCLKGNQCPRLKPVCERGRCRCLVEDPPQCNICKSFFCRQKCEGGPGGKCPQIAPPSPELPSPELPSPELHDFCVRCQKEGKIECDKMPKKKER